MTTVTADMTGLRDKMNTLQFVLGIPAATVVRVETKKLIETLVNFTPPMSRTKPAWAQGNAAVERDIRKAVFLVEPDRWNKKGIRKIVQNRDYPAFQNFMQNWKSKFGKKTLVRFSPSLHANVRNDRGRVSFSQHKLTLDAAEWKNYMAEMKRKVGRMKHGWGAAAKSVGITLPAWITGTQNPKGWVIDMLNAPNPSITVANTSRGIADNIGPIINQAIKIRTMALEKNIARLIKFGAGKSGSFETAYAQGA